MISASSALQAKGVSEAKIRFLLHSVVDDWSRTLKLGDESTKSTFAEYVERRRRAVLSAHPTSSLPPFVAVAHPPPPTPSTSARTALQEFTASLSEADSNLMKMSPTVTVAMDMGRRRAELRARRTKLMEAAKVEVESEVRERRAHEDAVRLSQVARERRDLAVAAAKRADDARAAALANEERRVYEAVRRLSVV